MNYDGNLHWFSRSGLTSIVCFTITYHLVGKSRVVSVRHPHRPTVESALSVSPPGRELGRNALDEYISTKAVHWNYGEDCEWPL
jgi:hypothetical protein